MWLPRSPVAPVTSSMTALMPPSLSCPLNESAELC